MNIKIMTERLADICRRNEGRGNIVITGHDMPDSDSVISAVMLKRLLGKFGIKSTVKFPTPPDNVTLRDMTTLGIWNDGYVAELSDDDLLLLTDHHKSFYDNEVIGCIDHHTAPPEPNCEYSLILKASSCGKIIYDMALACGKNDDVFEKSALYSIYLDTQSCRSSKFDRNDLPWIEKTAMRHSIDVQKLERMGFCLMSAEESTEMLAMYGYKKYEYDGIFSASTCIQIDVHENGWKEKIVGIVEHLQKRRTDDNCKIWAFVLNMPIEVRSDIYFISDSGVRAVHLDRLASRSKDVLPVIAELSNKQNI